MELWIVDRIESGFAVCEGANRTAVDLPLSELPAGIKEGDVIRLEGEAYQIDREETERRREENRRLLESLLEE